MKKIVKLLLVSSIVSAITINEDMAYISKESPDDESILSVKLPEQNQKYIDIKTSLNKWREIDRGDNRPSMGNHHNHPNQIQRQVNKKFKPKVDERKEPKETQSKIYVPTVNLEKNSYEKEEENEKNSKELTPNEDIQKESELQNKINFLTNKSIILEKNTSEKVELKPKKDRNYVEKEERVEKNRKEITNEDEQEEPEPRNKINAPTIILEEKEEIEENRKTKDPKKAKQRLMERPHVKQTTVAGDGFAYMAAVMKGAVYLCAGALIDESWVLTAGESVTPLRDNLRFIRIRLGSINFKKGGTVHPIKYMEIHPYFDINKPNYDVALLMLSKPVRDTPRLKSIRLQLTPKEVTATHFIVTSWPGYSMSNPSKTSTEPVSAEVMKRFHIMTMTHLHPSEPEECAEELSEINAGHEGVMCLSTGRKDDCKRETGAPVVLNGVLWAIVSSWVPEDCDEEDPALVFATQVSATNISTWIHATVHGHKWRRRKLYVKSPQTLHNKD